MSQDPDIVRLSEELKQLKLDEKLKSLQEEFSNYIDAQTKSPGAKELKKLFKTMNDGFKSGTPEEIQKGFKSVKERTSGFGILFEAFSPILEVVSGLFEVFIGYLRGGMMDSIQLMVDILSSDSVMNAVGIFADLIGNVLGPVIEGFADFLRLIFGDETLTDAEVGRAIGTVIGGAIGAALASYVGMTWTGAIIGAWLGGMIGEWVGATFGNEPVALAEGALVTSATYTILGEEGPEVVLPMRKLEMINSVEKSYLYEKILMLMHENNELMRMVMK